MIWLKESKPSRRFLRAAAAALLFGLAHGSGDFVAAAEAPSGMPSAALPVLKYATGTWNAENLGNQRVVLHVSGSGTVRAVIPWRRHDANPERKGIVLVEAATGTTLTNVFIASITAAEGDIVFEAPAAGAYHAYFLPKVSRGSHYPSTSYAAPEDKADPGWKKKAGLEDRGQPGAALEQLPRAEAVEIQAVNDFNSLYPMEVAATDGEIAALKAAHANERFLLFPEDRRFPIRMTDRIPYRWIQAGPQPEFSSEAAPNEFYAFQIGVFALADLGQVTVRFSDLKSADGTRSIPSAAMRCINLGGTNWDGQPFAKSVSVPHGQVQALWCGAQIPEDCEPGKYSGDVSVQTAEGPAKTIQLTLNVSGTPLADHGDSRPERMSRLRWLDSTLAQDEAAIPPFTPVRLEGNRLSILGRTLTLSPDGLPAAIESFFSPEGTGIEAAGANLLQSPMEFVIEQAGHTATWKPDGVKFTHKSDGLAAWTAQSSAGPLRLEVQGRMECDGFVRIQATLTSVETVDLEDVRLQLPLDAAKAKYFMGLGLQGQACPQELDWKWAVKNHQDSAWIGDVGGGLQFKLRGENYEPPLLTNFYEDKPLNLPPAWHNGGLGGITLRRTNNAALVSCYGGRRQLAAGQALHFDFDLLLTPFKPLNPKAQWATRFFHSYQPVEAVVKSGANTINIHHANDANPYINYPFLHVEQMRNYVAQAHARGLKVKIYDTMRELSNHAEELFALRSLGDEIFPGGKGGGDAWLQEHLGTNYLPAWFVPQWQDAAIIDKGSSRWDNYYIEGLDWLTKNVKIDGLYIDDLAYDRTTMKRVRKTLDRNRPGALIDFHSANQFNPHDGFGSCANVYLEHLPYVDRLWFGEYFNPDQPPAFWLLEMSGIPFGVMGEMLQDGGNRWRGMLYGMTSRIPYDGNDPSPLWRIWDEFKIQDSQMMGYWSPRCPVQTDNTNILATAYVKPGQSLIAIASWAPADEPVRLKIDWKTTGLKPGQAVLVAPEIAGFQKAARFAPDDLIPVPKGQGWLLYLEPK